MDQMSKKKQATFWAPELFHVGTRWHLFVTFIDEVRSTWGGEQRIAHFTSMSLSDAWHPVGLVSEDKGKGVPVPLVKVIDPEVQKLPSGTSIHLKLVPSFLIFLLFCFPGFYHP